jgi:hypothetical protein
MMPRRLARLAKTRYLVYVRIGEPARKHGIADQDILHAVRNAVTGFERGELTMIIGAARNGTLLESASSASRATSP